MFNSKQSKFGALSVAFTLIFIFVTVVLNIVVGLVVNKFDLKIDLTANKQYSISEESSSIMKNLKVDTKIYVLGTESNWKTNSADSLLMEKLVAASSKVKLEFVDLNTNPSFLTSKNVTTTADSTSGIPILVESGKRNKFIPASDLVDYTNAQTTGKVDSKLEQEVVSAVMYVSADNIETMLFTVGHGEEDKQSISDILTRNNFTIDNLSLSTAEIPATTKFITIMAPQTDFTDAEIAKLDTFLTNGNKYGRDLIVFFGPQRKALPKLEAYISEWGLKANNDLVIDSQKAVQQASNILVQTVDEKIGKSVKDKNIYLIAPQSSSIELLFDTKDIRKTKKLLTSYDTAGSYDLTNYVEGTTPKLSEGIKTIMAMSTKTEYVENSPVSSNLVVCGSIAFFSINSANGGQQFGNAEYMIDLFNNLRGSENQISILSKTVTTEPLSKIDIISTFIVAIIFIVIIPVIIIVLGIIIWRRRKNL